MTKKHTQREILTFDPLCTSHVFKLNCSTYVLFTTHTLLFYVSLVLQQQLAKYLFISCNLSVCDASKLLSHLCVCCYRYNFLPFTASLKVLLLRFVSNIFKNNAKTLYIPEDVQNSRRNVVTNIVRQNAVFLTHTHTTRRCRLIKCLRSAPRCDVCTPFRPSDPHFELTCVAIVVVVNNIFVDAVTTVATVVVLIISDVFPTRITFNLTSKLKINCFLPFKCCHVCCHNFLSRFPQRGRNDTHRSRHSVAKCSTQLGWVGLG